MQLILRYALQSFIIFVMMELLSWFLHQFVMHGWGWLLHKSHHEPKSKRNGIFELNDFYVIPFIIINILGFHFAVGYDSRFLPLPIGSTFYGICYFLFHEIIVHRRIPNTISSQTNHPYLIRLIRAHHIHHTTSTRKGAESFSFLYVSPKYGFKRPSYHHN